VILSAAILNVLAVYNVTEERQVNNILTKVGRGTRPDPTHSEDLFTATRHHQHHPERPAQ
jgi:hypothetical protein